MKCWGFSTKERWMERFDGEKQAFIVPLMGLIPHCLHGVQNCLGEHRRGVACR
ncbi:MAG: hypothetical protein F6K39_18850 [Okeania sp. SIO3B3]|nr:hypothetical protein [Okeania sp. SIO3B3]